MAAASREEEDRALDQLEFARRPLVGRRQEIVDAAQLAIEAAQLEGIGALVEGHDAEAITEIVREYSNVVQTNLVLARICWALADRVAAAELKLAAIAEVVEAAERATRVAAESRKGN